MGQKPMGREHLEQAKLAARNAKTIEELRVAQAVLLPLQYGLSLEQVAEIVGRSESWVASTRRKFFTSGDSGRSLSLVGHGGRRNQLMPRHEELRFMISMTYEYAHLHRYWRKYPFDGTIKYSEIEKTYQAQVQLALEKRVGRPVSRATAYNIMKRTALEKFGEASVIGWLRFARDLI